VLAGM